MGNGNVLRESPNRNKYNSQFDKTIMEYKAVVVSIWAWPHIAIPVTVDAEDELDALPLIVSKANNVSEIDYIVKGGIPFPSCYIGDLIIINGKTYAYQSDSFKEITFDESIMWQQMTSGEAMQGYDKALSSGKLKPDRFLKRKQVSQFNRPTKIIEETTSVKQANVLQEREPYDLSSLERVISSQIV